MKATVVPTFYQDGGISGLKIEFLVDPRLDDTSDEDAIRRFLDAVKRYQLLVITITERRPYLAPHLSIGGHNLAIDW